jgi:hypothetical protein
VPLWGRNLTNRFKSNKSKKGKDLKDFEQICWISRRRRLKKWNAPTGQKSHKSFQIKQIKKNKQI